MEQTTTVHHIPKDAVIPIQVGSGFLQKMQKLLMSLLHEKSEQEINEVTEMLKSGQDVQEDSWMYHVKTVYEFIASVEQAAIDQQLTVLKPIED